MGEIIKGKPVGDALSDQLKLECEALVKDGIQPKLAILRVGAKPNDLSYEKGALKKCETIGIQTEVTELPEGTTQDEYIAALEKLNNAIISSPFYYSCLGFTNLTPSANLPYDDLAFSKASLASMPPLIISIILPRWTNSYPIISLFSSNANLVT